MEHSLVLKVLNETFSCIVAVDSSWPQNSEQLTLGTEEESFTIKENVAVRTKAAKFHYEFFAKIDANLHELEHAGSERNVNGTATLLASKEK